MCLLIESIRFENGQYKNLELHNERMNCARFELFETSSKIDLNKVLSTTNVCKEVQRVRITYNEEIQSIVFIPYIRKLIQYFKIVIDNEIDYKYKYADRKIFDKFLTDKNCDIIIIKNGLVTDTSFSNIVFYDGAQWVTPASPLLKGTMREYLIKSGLIIEKAIKPDDIRDFKKFRLINAFNGFENPFEFSISAIQMQD
jgi:4-amino-4-deoxychorismate lyase